MDSATRGQRGALAILDSWTKTVAEIWGKIYVENKMVRRQLFDHMAEPKDPILFSMDEPGAGGANHIYGMCEKMGDKVETILVIQNGPIKEAGLNGWSNEMLVAVVIDRLRAFQKGPYACRENALQITSLEEALMWAHSRTRNRILRGVEGTSSV